MLVGRSGRSRHTAAGIPSSAGQTEAPHGFHAHRAYKNDLSPNAAWYQARKTPDRPQATWPQGYRPHAGSAGEPRTDTFSSGTCSSSVSAWRFDKRLDNRETVLSPCISPTATIGYATEAFSDSLLAQVVPPNTWHSCWVDGSWLDVSRASDSQI